MKIKYDKAWIPQTWKSKDLQKEQYTFTLCGVASFEKKAQEEEKIEKVS
jgi:hypothetical protein